MIRSYAPWHRKKGRERASPQGQKKGTKGKAKPTQAKEPKVVQVPALQEATEHPEVTQQDEDWQSEVLAQMAAAEADRLIEQEEQQGFTFSDPEEE